MIDPFESGPMIPISVPFLISFASALELLADLPPRSAKMSEIQHTLSVVKGGLRSVYEKGSIYSQHLRVSSVPAGYLDATIGAVMNKHGLDAEVPEIDIMQIKAAYERYKHVMLSDLQSLDVYLITQKPPYSISFLLSSGESLFPDDLSLKVPDARFDAQQAAKCLVFELPTACGFHVFRVVESVLRTYYAAFSGGRAAPKVRSLGVYINAMVQRNAGDQRVLSALKQMADLHRNPLIHPETALTMDEVQATIGMARSVTSLMLLALPAPPATTATASAIPP